jgi:hypothetical protein
VLELAGNASKDLKVSRPGAMLAPLWWLERDRRCCCCARAPLLLLSSDAHPPGR